MAGSTGHSVEAAGGGALARTGSVTSGADGGAVAGSTRHTVEAGGGGALAGIGPGDDGGAHLARGSPNANKIVHSVSLHI